MPNVYIILIFVAVILLVAWGIYKMRKQRSFLVNAFKSQGCHIRKIEIDRLPRWEVEYEDPSGEIRRALVEIQGQDLNYSSDEPVDYKFARECSKYPRPKVNPKDTNKPSPNEFSLLLIAGEKNKYRKGPAVDCLTRILNDIAEGKQSQVTLQEQDTHILINGTPESDVRFSAILQQVRLIHEEQVTDSGNLDLTINGSDVIIDWQCSGSSPVRTLVISKQY